MQKSEGQDETTENSRNIPETSHKNETTEDNTDMFDTEGQQTQDNTHISETSERPDETNQHYTEITKKFGTKGETIQEGTHLSDTSETRDEMKEDYTGNSNTFGTEEETTQDGTHISDTSEMQHQTETQDDTEIQFEIQIQDPSCRQGSTTEDQTNISHREDRKETAQSKDPSESQGSTTEDHTKICLREDTNKTAQRQVSHREASSTEHNRKIANRQDGKEASQGRVSQGEGSSTEKNRMVLDREDGEEKAQERLSYRQGSTIENNREIANRKNEKEAGQGRVSHRQGSTTEDNTEEEALKQNRWISVKEDNQLFPKRNKEEDRFNNNTTVPEDFRSSDTKEVPTYPGAMNYHSTPQLTAQMNPYGNNHSASWFAPTNMNTSTPVNEAGFPFMDSMMDNLFSENVMRNISLQPAPSGNPTSTTIGNANSILYGMDNYVNDVPQQGFHSTEECNIGNNIKIRISIDSKIPVEISQEQEQHEHMASNRFCQPWQNDSTLINSLHHGKDPSTDNRRMPGTSEIGINCKPYKINMKRHRKYSFTKAGDDKLPQVETPKQRKQERRDSLDSCCQTPSDWTEPKNYDINNLLQDASTEESTRNSRKNNST